MKKTEKKAGPNGGSRPGSGMKSGQLARVRRDLWRDLEAVGMNTSFDNPVVFMAKVYAGQVPGKISLQLKAFCADKVASYIYPRLKSVEFKQAPDAPAVFDVSQLPTETLEALRNQLLLIETPEPKADESVRN